MSVGFLPDRLTRRVLLGGLLGTAAGTALANAPVKSLRPLPRDPVSLQGALRPLDEVLAEARLPGKVAFVVADAGTGEVLEVKSPLLGLPPASVTKAVTAVYALETLGPDYRFRTRIVATGPVTDGKVQGDLILEGGGDPTLDTDALGEMVATLKEMGVRGVTGAFKVSSGAWPSIHSIDPGQPAHVGYNPTISGLNLNYNRVHFAWKRQSDGYEVSMDARASKFSPEVRIARMRVVDRSQPVYTYSDAGEADEWTVAQPALGQGGSRWLPVRKPDAYAAEVFQTLARAHGLSLPKAEFVTATPEGETLTGRESAPLRDVMRDMLKWSTNLTAEVAGLAATAARGHRAETLEDSAAHMSEWAREALGMRKARFVDHSGLGEASRMCPRDMVLALLKARALGALPALMKDIPLRDAAGEPMPNHPVTVRAKTGTLNFVSALAGYISTAGDRDLVFAYFSADMAARDALGPDDGEIPDGSRAWTARSRNLQMQLIHRWSTAYAV